MRQVYLSPHLDDAVLSCGGSIHRHAASGEPVWVLTLFAGEFVGGEVSPFARVQHQYWGNPPRPMALRRAEDSAALVLLGAEGQYFDLLDAVYRAGEDGAWLYSGEASLWGCAHPADAVAQNGAGALADRLAALFPSDQAIIHAPLGVGRHVDHQIVHAAARRLLALGYRVAFYEDYPYAERAGTTQAAVALAGAEAWRVEPVSLSPAALGAKVCALGYYRTQMAMLFGGAEAMPSRVWAFAASRSPQVPLAERLWWPPGA